MLNHTLISVYIMFYDTIILSMTVGTEDTTDSRPSCPDSGVLMGLHRLYFYVFLLSIRAHLLTKCDFLKHYKMFN